MKLSMSMLDAYLAGYDKESVIQQDDCTIRGVRFLSEQAFTSSHAFVYIGAASHYLDDPNYEGALMLACGKSHIVCKGHDLEELLNDALAAFDFYNECEQQLAVAAAAHEPLERMMGPICAMLDEPFLVFGIDGSFLAGSNVDRMADKRILERILENDNMGAGSLGGYYVDENGEILHDLSDVPQVASSDGVVAVSMYLYQGEEAIGFVMCFPNKLGGDALAVSLEPLLAKYLADAEEFTSGSSPHQSQHLALAELVQGAPVSREAQMRLLALIGSPTNSCIVSARSLVVQNRTQRMMLMGEIEAAPVPCVSCEVNDTVAFLVPEADVQDLLCEIAGRFDEKSVAVGVSMPASALECLPIAYRQAVFACDAVEGPGTRFCRDLAMSFFVDTLRKEPAVHDLLHPAIAALEAYDRANGADLLDTTRAYIRCGCNQVEAARLLFVHLNTLKYRIKRITELTGIDFKDQGSLIYLQLSMMILEYGAS